MSNNFLPTGGGYRKLKAYQIAEIICDLSVLFVKRFVPRNSRTCDQMEQAARSGKQNIAEGSSASITSKETEIKLTNVARASLEELLLDYEDYLRQHHLAKWDKNHPRTKALRECLQSERFMTNPQEFTDRYSAEEYCNVMISLIYQCMYMLRNYWLFNKTNLLSKAALKNSCIKLGLISATTDDHY